MLDDPRGVLRTLFDAALDAVAPERCLPAHLPPAPNGRTLVLAAGKAAASMAAAVERHFDGPLGGLAVTRYGHAVPCSRVEVVEAGHPLPDDAGIGAARTMLELATRLGPDDLLLGLWSGGGSAVLAWPPEGLSLDDVRAVHGGLLRAGAPIGAINDVRRHLSRLADGRLAAAAAPARIVGLVLSDVPGDDPATVASGPTAIRRTDVADPLEILERYAVKPPDSVRRFLERWRRLAPEPESQADRTHVVVAGAETALRAAAEAAAALGIDARILGTAMEGESRLVAEVHARLALAQRLRIEGPTVFLSGGETTVRVVGPGIGGPNQEYVLALALALDGAPGIHAIACDTDGADGQSDAAGAHIAPDTLDRAHALGIDPWLALGANDADPLFTALGDRVVTGPTRTNVNDFRAILIQPGVTTSGWSP